MPQALLCLWQCSSWICFIIILSKREVEVRRFFESANTSGVSSSTDHCCYNEPQPKPKQKSTQVSDTVNMFMHYWIRTSNSTSDCVPFTCTGIHTGFFVGAGGVPVSAISNACFHQIYWWNNKNGWGLKNDVVHYWNDRDNMPKF